MVAGFLVGAAAGLASTVHCVGMCGVFPLHLSRASQRAPVLLRQLLYLAGKTFTYVFLGALLGVAGNRLASLGWLPRSQHVFAIAAGTVIILFGLGMLGVRMPSARFPHLTALSNAVVRPVYQHLFAHPGAGSSFALGLANGFLPCPMTLAMLTGAAATQSPLDGMLVLAGFGLGTAPGLLAVGMCGSLVDARWRRIGLRPAGVIVILLGAMAIARTQGFLHHGCHAGTGGEPSCCAVESSAGEEDRPAAMPGHRAPAHSSPASRSRAPHGRH